MVEYQRPKQVAVEWIRSRAEALMLCWYVGSVVEKVALHRALYLEQSLAGQLLLRHCRQALLHSEWCRFVHWNFLVRI